MKVLCWNIKFFQKNTKFGKPWGKPLILRSVYPNGPHAAPAVDVFAILEVQNKIGGAHVIGAPLRPASAGAQAVADVWVDLQALNAPGVASWRLIPPLSLSTTKKDEGIAVFYNGETVDFLGPNQFGGAISERNPAHPQPWPAPWAACGDPPNYWAGRVAFTPAALNAYLTEFRRPYQIRLRAIAAPHATFDFFFIHTTPPFRMNPDLGDNPSLLACHYLALIDDVAHPQHDGVTATVLIGDFNVNAANQQRWHQAFQPLQAIAGYRSALPVAGGAGAPTPTILKQDGSPAPPNPIPAPAVDTYYWSRWSVDNALWSPAGVNGQGTVVDRTAGVPAAWPSVMAQTMNDIYDPPPGVQGLRFNALRNHGQNAEVSDHVGLFFEIS